MTTRVLFHVNHLWGLGHFTRIAAIANAVIAQGHEAMILSGNTPAQGRLHTSVRLMELPVIRSPDTTYARLTDAEGGAVSENLWQARAGLIAEALVKFQPHVVVTETFPFGRRKLAREILPLLADARAQGAAIVASVRDLPTVPDHTKRLDECAARLTAYYDLALVHADPSVMGLQDVWPGDVPVPCLMTGYVVPEPVHHFGKRAGVIVSAGGGGDAAPVLRAARALRETGFCAAEAWTFITGPTAPDDLLNEIAEPHDENIQVHRSVPDLAERIGKARLSISRGGYNTVLETLTAGTRAVIVPFATAREPEQRLRAEMFAASGWLNVLNEDDLTPARLKTVCEEALARPAPDASMLNCNGANASALRLAELAASG